MQSPIVSDPDVLHGAARFAGTRVPIDALFDAISHNRTLEDFLAAYPSVDREQVLAVLRLAGDKVSALPGHAA